MEILPIVYHHFNWILESRLRKYLYTICNLESKYMDKLQIYGYASYLLSSKPGAK